MRGLVICWMLIGGLGFLIFPWYVTGDGFFSINWILEYSLEDYGSLLPQVFINKKYWLLPILVPLIFPLTTFKLNQNNPIYSKIFLYSGLIGFFYFFLQGFSIGIRGWNFEILQSIFGDVENQFEIILQREDIEGILASAVAISYMKNDERGKLVCIENLLAFGRLDFLDEIVLASLREIINKYNIAKEAKIFALSPSENFSSPQELISERNKLIKGINGLLQNKEDLNEFLLELLNKNSIEGDDFELVVRSIIPLACRQRQIIKIQSYLDKFCLLYTSPSPRDS